MEDRAEYKVGPAIQRSPTCECQAEIQVTDASVSSRLSNVLDRLNGGCRGMEDIVGIPEGAKNRDIADVVSKTNNVDMFLEAIEYRVGELLAQIERLGRWMG